MRRSHLRSALVSAATTLTAVLTVAAGPVAEAGPMTAQPSTAERAASSITARLPSGKVRQDERLLITGRLVGGVDRLIQVQQHARNGTWVTLAQTRPAADGSFSVAAPTWWVATQTLRVYAPGTATDLPAVSVATTVTVTANHRPRGGTAFSLLTDQGRWDPCHGPLTYRISDRITPARFPLRAMAAKAFDQVSAATGFTFRYGGTTSRIPYAKKRDAYPANTDLLLGWVSPRTTRIPAEDWRNVAGYGGSTYTGSSGQSVMTAGQGNVGLNADGLKRWRQMTRHHWMIVLLHEIGHAIGLGHVEDERQVMRPGSYGIDTSYGAGDLRGFDKIGADAGCIGGATGRSGGVIYQETRAR